MKNRIFNSFAQSLTMAVCVWLLVSPVFARQFDLEHTKTVIEKIVQKELDAGIPSISLSLVKGDEIIWSAAYGYANVGMKVAATPEVYYNTASTLKPVTATAILTLVEQGKIKLDDPANKYLDEHAVQDSPRNSITVRSLLDHTSGLSDELGQAAVDVLDRNRSGNVSLVDIASSLKSLEPLGKGWRYNNSAYAVAGLLIEKTSGMPFEDYIIEYVMAPLGVTTTNPINPTGSVYERLSIPYSLNKEGELEAVVRAQTDVYPAGDAYFRPQDMARFLGAHINGGVFNGQRILSEELIEESHRVIKELYGMGWWSRKDDSGYNMIFGGGRGKGYSISAIGDKDNRIGAYVMTNSDSQASYRVADAAVRLMRGEEVSLEERKAVKIDQKKLNKLAGRYLEEKLKLPIRITVGDNKLYYAPDLPGFEGAMVYLPTSETTFFNASFGIEMTFQKNKKGEITGYSTMQHGWLDYGFAERTDD